MNNKSAKYIIKKFSVIGDRRFGFSCHFEAHQRLLSLQISQPYLFMHWKKLFSFSCCICVKQKMKTTCILFITTLCINRVCIICNSY